MWCAGRREGVAAGEGSQGLPGPLSRLFVKIAASILSFISAEIVIL